MSTRGEALTYKIASVLLQYPDDHVLGSLPDTCAALPLIPHKAARRSVGEFVGWLRARSHAEAAEHYVSTFDLRRRCCLYLSYYRHGDTRARGMALLAMKQAYRAAGHQPPDNELPDYLPLLLEFAAMEPDAGRELLVRCQPGLELLRQGLAETSSPYRHLIDAVCAGLPTPGRQQRATIAKLRSDGPPGEQVGLEPFAPPEYITGEAR